MFFRYVNGHSFVIFVTNCTELSVLEQEESISSIISKFCSVVVSHINLFCVLYCVLYCI